MLGERHNADRYARLRERELPMRLGKFPYKHDKRHFMAANMLRPLTIAPAKCRWGQGTQSGMMGNDVLGCCTWSAAGHMIQAWTGNSAKHTTTVSDDDIRRAYWGTGSQDDGRYMADVLKYWRQTGLGGRRILGYALVNTADEVEVKQASLVFGGLYLGLALPTAWQAADVWDRVDFDSPGTWGGHAVNVVDYGQDGLVLCTWGQLQRLTWEGLRWACDEAWAVMSDDFLASEVAPTGFNRDAMVERLGRL
jgi:hypothetical protein